MKTTGFLSFMCLIIAFLTFSVMADAVHASPPSKAITVIIPSSNEVPSNVAIEYMREVCAISPTGPQRLYAFEGRTVDTLSSATAISLTPMHTLTVFLLTADTNVTFTALTSHAIIGDCFILKVLGHTRNRTMTFSTNIYSVSDTITAGKTVMYEFMWTGDGYQLVAKAATN